MNLRALSLAALLALLPLAAHAQALYVEGRHYHSIEPAQPTEVADGKVEVVEVFSYACVHCANFEPHIAAWKANKPDNVEFRGLPAIFSPAWEPFGRAYFAAQALGVLDQLHRPLFQALHEQRQRLTTIEAIADFAGSQGIDRDQFLQAANSSSTTTKINRAREQAQRYGVDGTPVIIVNGKYRVPSVGGFQSMIAVVDHLVAQEAAAATP